MAMNAIDSMGTRYDWEPVPMVLEATTFFDVGPIAIGVEYRRLNEDVVRAAHPDQVAAGVLGAESGRTIGEDKGVSLHVCDSGSRQEYLRFDAFEDVPHYHYIVPGSHNVRIVFDDAADGEFLAWALERLRSRLPEMLGATGATELASSIDQEDVASVMPAVRSEVDKAVANQRV